MTSLSCIKYFKIRKLHCITQHSVHQFNLINIVCCCCVWPWSGTIWGACEYSIIPIYTCHLCIDLLIDFVFFLALLWLHVFGQLVIWWRMRERGDDMGHRSDYKTLGNCSEDIASVHGAHTLPSELLWRPISAWLIKKDLHFSHKNLSQENPQRWKFCVHRGLFCWFDFLHHKQRDKAGGVCIVFDPFGRYSNNQGID